MGKGRRSVGDGELRDNKRLKLENQKLRKQISSLRKQLNRIDIDRYQSLKDIIEAHEEEDAGFAGQLALADLKKQWECHGCKTDFLRLVVVPRIDGMFYFRRCPTCKNKTKLKKYTDEVEGIDSEDKVYIKT
jgi:hypothetical protein